jgi:replicative DNA helicase
MSTTTDDALRRIPPQSIEAEQSVLGSVLFDNTALDRALEILTADDFYREIHRQIFKAMVALTRTNSPIDVITLMESLRGTGALEQIGGPAYIAELAESVPSARNVEHYAKIVQQKALLRAIATAARDIDAEAFEPNGDADAFLETVERRILAIRDGRSRASFVPMKAGLPDALHMIEWRAEHKGEVLGLATGIRDLDALTAGFQPGELIIVGARPTVGKSALALNIAQHNTLRVEKPVSVAIFSLEMSRQELTFRALAAEAHVDGARMKSGYTGHGDYPRLAQAAAAIADAPQIFIDDGADLTPMQMRSKCRRLARETKNLGLVIVDYLQLAQSAQRTERRELDIAEISRSLKALAKELGIPVIALSQLNRQVEMRDNKRPRLADLRESGAIEQDADVILFLYREEVYNPDKERGIAEIIVAKQRNGIAPITVKAAFLKEFQQFCDLETHQVSPELNGYHARIND